MNIVALLTGRGNNTMKDKNVLPVLGHPLLYYPAVAANDCKYVTHTFCSSDDQKILSEAYKLGYESIVRPPELALPTSRHIDAITHAIEEMKLRGVVPDILVVLLANNGTITTEIVTDSILMLLDEPSLSAVCPVMKEQDHHPYRAKKLRSDGCLEPFFDFENKDVSTNRQDLCECFFFCHNFWVLNLKNTPLYDDSIVGQKPWTFMGDKVKPIVVEECFDVHDADDIVRTEKWILKNNPKVINRQ